jgi:ankyrin repeat protein
MVIMLLSCFTRDSLAIIEQALKENAAALQEIKHRTKSIRSSHPDVSVPESVFEIELDVKTITDDERRPFYETDSVIGPSVFDFDDQVVNSSAYRKALVLVQMRHKAAAGAPREESTPDIDGLTINNRPNRSSSPNTSFETEEILQRRRKAEVLIKAIQDLLTSKKYAELEEVWLSNPSALSLISPNETALPLDRATVESGGTLLHEAARRQDIKLIQQLLVNGADPFMRDRRGRLPQEVTKDDKTRAVLRNSPAAVAAMRGVQERIILGGNEETPMRECKGYLKRWEGYRSGFKLRWFVLEEGVLSYYANQGKPQTQHFATALARRPLQVQLHTCPAFELTENGTH